MALENTTLQEQLIKEALRRRMRCELGVDKYCSSAKNLRNHHFIETIEISVFGEGIVDFYASQIIFKNKNILKNEIRYYDHQGNLIFNSYPDSKAECHQGKLKHSGYVKIMIRPEDDLDKYFIN